MMPSLSVCGWVCELLLFCDSNKQGTDVLSGATVVSLGNVQRCSREQQDAQYRMSAKKKSWTTEKKSKGTDTHTPA